MSTQIENRVVRMEFDNARFEKNIKVTSDTLSKFDEKLKFKDAQKGFNNVEKGFQSMDNKSRKHLSNVKTSLSDAKTSLSNIQNTINKFTVDPIGNSIDGLKFKFSALQVAGITAIANLTTSVMNAGKKLEKNTIGQIMSGGKSRALNIENAKFKIQGLKKDWDALYQDMDYAVTGTAYGIDQAANAAAQFAASGIEAGEDMKAALRAISGVAAMTGASYTEIADVFTSAAGKGRVQQIELQRLAARGINVSAALANQLSDTSKGIKVTENDIRNMTQKGKLDFKTFADAMDRAFGEQATKANDTFQGALMNTKAALSRIGEPFYTSLHEDLRLGMLSLMPVINKFKNAIAPKDGQKIRKNSVMGITAKGMDFLREKFVTTMNTIEKNNRLETVVSRMATGMSNNFSNFKSVVESTLSVIKNAGTIVKELLAPIKRAFSDVFPAKNELGFMSTIAKTIASSFNTATKAVSRILNPKDVKGHKDSTLYSVLTAIISSAKLTGKAISAVWRIIKKLFVFVEPAATHLSKAINLISSKIYDLNTSIMESKNVKIFLDFIDRAIDALIAKMKGAKEWGKPVIDFLKNTYRWIYEKISPGLKIVQNGINRFKTDLFKNIDNAFRPMKDGPMRPILESMGPAAKIVKAKTGEIKTGISSVSNESFLSSAFRNIGAFFDGIGNKIKALKSSVSSSNGLGTVGDTLKEIFSKLGDAFKVIVSKFNVNATKNGDGLLKTGLKALSSGLDSLIQFLKENDIVGIADRITKILTTGALAKFIYNRASSPSIVDGFMELLKSVNYFTSTIGKLATLKPQIKVSIFKTIVENMADIFKSLAILIGAISVSLFILSTVDPKKLSTAGEALTRVMIGVIGLMAVLIAMAKWVNGSNSSTKDVTFANKKLTAKSDDGIFVVMSKFIRSIGESVLMVAIAAKVISTIGNGNSGAIFGAMTAITYIMGLIGAMTAVILASVKELESSDNSKIEITLKSLSKFIKKLSGAIRTMALTVLILGKFMDTGQLIKGSIALGLITAAILLVMRETSSLSDTLLGYNKTTGLKDTASSKVVTVIGTFTKFISVLSTAFLKMGAAMLLIGKLTDWGSWTRGILTLGLFAAFIVVLMNQVKNIDDTVMGKNTKAGAKFSGKARAKFKKLSNYKFNNEQIVTKLDKFSNFINALANSIIKVSLAVAVIAKLTDQNSWTRAMVTLGSFSAVIAGLMLLSDKILGANFDKTANAIIKISASMLIVAIALQQAANISWEGIGKGLVGILGVLSIIVAAGAFSSIGNIGKGLEHFGNSIMKMGIGLAAAGFGILQFVNAWEKIELLDLAPDVLVNFFTTVFKAIPGILKGFMKGLIDLIVTFIVGLIEGVTERMAELITAIGKFLKAFISTVQSLSSEFDMKEVISAFVTVGIVVALIALLALASKLGKDALKGIGMMALVVTIVTAMFAVVLKLSNGEGVLQAATGLAAAIAAIAGLSFTAAGLAKFTKGVSLTAIVKAFGIIAIATAFCIVIMGLIALVADWASNIDDAHVKAIKRGLDIMEMISGGIGRIIGAFVGSIAGGALVQIGQALSDFWIAAGTFIEGAQNLKPESMEGLIKFSEALAILLGGTILYGIGKAINNPLSMISDLFNIFKKSPLQSLGEDLAAFSPHMVTFASAMSKIKNPDNVKKMCKIIGQCIGDLEKNLPYNVGGFWGFFEAKKQSLSEFGKEMAVFSDNDHFGKFVSNMTKLKFGKSLVTQSENVGKMIKSLQENLPYDVEAFWNFFSGQVKVKSKLGDFGIQMGYFAENFETFASAMESIDISAFDKGAKVAEMVKTFNDSMGEVTVGVGGGFGILGFFESKKQSLANFASDLKSSSADFKTFIEDISDVDTTNINLDAVQTIVDVLVKFSDFQNNNLGDQWKPGPVIEFFAGHSTTLTEFAQGLKDSVPTFRELATSIANGEWKQITEQQKAALNSCLTAIGTFVTALPDDTSTIDKWADIGKDRMSKLHDFLFGYERLATTTADVNGHAQASFVHSGSADNPVMMKESVSGIIGLVTVMTNMLAKIDFKGLDTEKVGKITSTIDSMFGVVKKITDSGIDLSDSKTQTKIANFGDWVRAAGQAIIDVANLIKASNQFATEGKINQEDYDILVLVADAMVKVFDAYNNFKTVATDSYGTILDKALNSIGSVIDKFKDLSTDIDIDKAQMVIDWFNLFTKDFANLSADKIKKIDTVNQAFANLASSAFEISNKTALAEDQSGDSGIDYLANRLSSKYNDIILKALFKSKTEIDKGYLNSKQITTEYPIMETMMKKLVSGVKVDDNAFYNKLVAIENAAYNKLYSYTHTDNKHTEDHNFYKVGKYIAEGMAYGMNTNRKSVINAATTLGEVAIVAAMRRLHEKSPSKEFITIGEYASKGFAIGIIRKTKDAEKASEQMANSSLSATNKAIGGYKEFYRNGEKMAAAWKIISRGKTYTPTIAPIMDTRTASKQYSVLASPKTQTISVMMDKKSVDELANLSNKFDIIHEQKIAVDNRDVVSAIHDLDSRFTDLEHAIDGMEVTMDGDKTVGAIASKINRKMGDLQSRSRRGN